MNKTKKDQIFSYFPKSKAKLKLLLMFLIIILLGINYPLLDRVLNNFIENYEFGIVERVIDGDTLVVNETTVRLLGINCPEKGEKYYEEAKEYLENLTLHKFVKLKRTKEDLDIYKRKLRYVLIGSTNINLEIVKAGYANFYFPSGKDIFYKEFKEAWKECVSRGLNICEKSKDKCAFCIEIKNFNFEKQSLTLKNNCQYSCDLNRWTIKDEGRKKFEFENFTLDREITIKVGVGENTNNTLFWAGEEYVWTNTGDTIILRDKDDKLVLWWNY